MKRKKEKLQAFADRQARAFQDNIFEATRENQKWAVLAMEIQKLRRLIEENYLQEAPYQPVIRFLLSRELVDLAIRMVNQPNLEGGNSDTNDNQVIEMEGFEDDET